MTKYTIPSIKDYVSEMEKAVTLEDKLWFLKHVWVKRMVEIGTGAGSIPHALADKFDHTFESYAYDPNPNMIYEAQRKQVPSNGDKDLFFYDDYHEFKNDLTNRLYVSDITVLSSVLHELYDGGCCDGSREKFYNLVRIADSKYVAIRDMCLTNGNLATPVDVSIAIRKNGDPDQIKDYEKYKSLSNWSNAVEFLLKYRYKINWEREVQENYLKVDWGEVDFVMKLYGYELIRSRYFTPEFIKKSIKEDFEIDAPNTHCELLYRKKY